MSAKVFVVDDDPLVLQALQRAHQSVKIECRTFGSAYEFLRREGDQAQGCLLADLKLPGLGGLGLLQEIKGRQPAIPVVIMTGFSDVPTAISAMKLGAMDYLEKPLDLQQVLSITALALRQFEATTRTREVKAEIQLRHATLSPREREVAGLIVAGLSTKLIAARLSISIFTVNIHRTNIMRKMDAGSVADLVRDLCACDAVS